MASGASLGLHARQHFDQVQMKLPTEQRCASIPDMKIRHAVAALLLLSCSSFAQQKQQQQQKAQNQTGAADRLGMTCAQILAMRSTDWIAKIAALRGSSGDGELRGIRSYGQCYDARTDQLAAALARKGAGPKKSALANFKDFEQGLKDFTAKTLADTEPPGDPVKIAYAAFYEKQFRYEFYQAYEQRTLKPAAPSKAVKPAPGKDSQAPVPDPGATSAKSSATASELPEAPKKMPLSGLPVANRPTASPPTPAPEKAPEKVAETEPTSKDIDPFTKAKNHFGELLGLLPEEKMREVHSAFGKLFSGNPVSEDLKPEVYRYAIFLLEWPSDPPFAPPPF
jgi:hypothetical protein